MLVLDATILIDALRSNRAAPRKVAEIVAEEEIVCTTEVNVLERFKSQWLGFTTKGRRHKGTKGKFYAVHYPHNLAKSL